MSLGAELSVTYAQFLAAVLQRRVELVKGPGEGHYLLYDVDRDQWRAYYISDMKLGTAIYDATQTNPAQVTNSVITTGYGLAVRPLNSLLTSVTPNAGSVFTVKFGTPIISTPLTANYTTNGLGTAQQIFPTASAIASQVTIQNADAANNIGIGASTVTFATAYILKPGQVLTLTGSPDPAVLYSIDNSVVSGPLYGLVT